MRTKSNFEHAGNHTEGETNRKTLVPEVLEYLKKVLPPTMGDVEV